MLQLRAIPATVLPTFTKRHNYCFKESITTLLEEQHRDNFFGLSKCI